MFNKTKLGRWLLSLSLLAPMVAVMAAGHLAFAAEESLKLSTDFPSIKDAVGGNYSFTVNIAYAGTEPRLFELSAQVPKGASAQILSSGSSEVTAIGLDPTIFSSNYVTVNFSPSAKGAPVAA